MMDKIAGKNQNTANMCSRGLAKTTIFAEYLLKLGMASTYIWLLVFYGYFHVFFNLLAEVLKFGDRV